MLGVKSMPTYRLKTGGNTRNLPCRTVIKRSLWNSFLPVARLTMAVHYRNNKNVIWLDSVENGVRKDTGKVAAHILFKKFPLFRLFDNMKDSLFD